MLDEMTAIGSVGVMIGTVILALFTAWLAFTTRKMARATVKLTKQENQQHVDNVRPVCVLEPNDNVKGKDVFHTEIGEKNHTRGVDMHKSSSCTIIFLKCSIRNKGLGPALGLRLITRIIDKHKEFDQIIPSGVIQVGEAWSMIGPQVGTREQRVIPIEIKFGDNYTDTDYTSFRSGLWEIFLEYQDIFGNVYHTKYMKAGNDFFSGCFKGIRPKLGEPPRMPERQEYGSFELGHQI